MSSLKPTVGNDIYAEYGRRIVKRFLDEHQATSTPLPSAGATEPVSRGTPARRLAEEPVGILGAGGAGLYTALILDDLGIPFKIIEARGRVGGRLYTHTFPNETGQPYNYFDVGAMRFPRIKSMNRVFHLFDYPPLNTGGLALKAKLQPFYFVGGGNNNTLLSYGGVTVLQNTTQESDPFQSTVTIQDTNAGPYIAAGAKAIVDDVIKPFAERLLQDQENKTDDGLKYLLGFDRHSTRSYMTTVYIPSAHLGLPATSLPADVVNWLETFDKSTGWYDRAFVETVLEAIAFGWNPSLDPMSRTPWFCIEGGSFQIADTLHRYLRGRHVDAFTFNKRVTSIKKATNARGDAVMSVVTDFSHEHLFSHVITTIPLPVMRVVDLSEAGLHPMQANAMRTLNYGPSIKIGMQFRTAWWTHGVNQQGQPLDIVGGQTYTDSPLRTVVYPSFGDVKGGKTTTLIASYCWTEDAERLAPLIANDMPTLKKVVLRELAKIHDVSIDYLQGQLLDTFAWSWSQDPYTMGAFAFFGPGKFNNLYTSLTRPAGDGRLHFAGEAISVRHAWLEGAFDSAWRAVYELVLQPGFESYQDKFYKNWGLNAEWFDAPLLWDAPKSGERGGFPQEPDLANILKHSLLKPLVSSKSF